MAATHPPPIPAKPLTSDHHRLLHAYFRNLDDRLLELDAILGGNARTAGSELTATDRRDLARGRLADLRETISVFASRWSIDMTRFEATAAHLALVHLAFLLADLDELDAGRLRGYGAVGAEFVSEYEGLLGRLHDGLERIKCDILAVTTAPPLRDKP